MHSIFLHLTCCIYTIFNEILYLTCFHCLCIYYNYVSESAQDTKQPFYYVSAQI